jgi:hypothetical protein
MDVPRTPPATLRGRANHRARRRRRYVYTGNVSDPEGEATRCPRVPRGARRARLVRRPQERARRPDRCPGAGTVIPGVFERGDRTSSSGRGWSALGERRVDPARWPAAPTDEAHMFRHPLPAVAGRFYRATPARSRATSPPTSGRWPTPRRPSASWRRTQATSKQRRHRRRGLRGVEVPGPRSCSAPNTPAWASPDRSGPRGWRIPGRGGSGRRGAAERLRDRRPGARRARAPARALLEVQLPFLRSAQTPASRSYRSACRR